MVAAPVLFLAGVAFAYCVVLPPAVHFLQGYNSQNFDILVQAKTYYTFQILTMLGIGLAFQLPLGLLALQRLGDDQRPDADAELALRYGHHRGHRGRHARGGSGHDRRWRCSRSSSSFWPVSCMLKIADRRAAARAAREMSDSFGDGLDPT